MARDPHIETRLIIWAQWLTTGDGSGYPTMSVLHPEWSPPSPGVLPTLMVAAPSTARQTHRAVRALSMRLANTLFVHYCMKLPISEQAVRLECAERTVHGRIEEAHRHGVTSVQNSGGEAGELAVFDALRSAGELKLRVYHAITLPPSATDADLARLDETRRQYGDDPVLKTGAVEITADGLTREALSRLVSTLDRRGWQIWIRTQTSQAVQWALGAMASVLLVLALIVARGVPRVRAL